MLKENALRIKPNIFLQNFYSSLIRFSDLQKHLISKLRFIISTVLHYGKVDSSPF